MTELRKSMRKYFRLIFIYTLLMLLIGGLIECGSWKVKHSIEIEKRKTK